MAKKKATPKPEAVVKSKPKMNKYKCDKCGTEFSVVELNYPVCTNPDCNSTCATKI